MKKKLVALLLAALIVFAAFAFVGCQGGSGGSGGGNKGGEVVDLTWIMGYTEIPPEKDIVEEYLNKMSEEDLGVHNNTLYLSGDDALLYMMAGDPWDMGFTCAWYNNFAVRAGDGYFADLEGHVQELTPDLWNSMPEVVWSGGYYKDELLAIPVKKDYAAMIYWRFDKQLVDELGIDYESCTTFESIEPVLAQIKEYKPEEYPLILNKTAPSLESQFDMFNREIHIGLSYNDQGGPDEAKVVLTYEHPDYLKRLYLMRDWYQAGYINPDANVLTEAPKYSAVKHGQGFYGADAIWTNGDGYEQVISMFSGPYLSTDSVRGAMNAINKQTEYFEESLKFQEYVNTNLDYRDAIRYGVPGTHWEYTTDDPETRLVRRLEGGADAYNPWAFSQGSYMLSTPEEGSEPQMWKVVEEDMESAEATVAMGFTFDVTPVEAKVLACQSIVTKYDVNLITGVSDPDTTLPQFIKELEDAGIRDIIAEAQKQLDEFIAAQD